MTERLILEKTRTLIDREEKWCQNKPRSVENGEVTQRDLFTAMCDAARMYDYHLGSQDWERARDFVFAETRGHGITRFNDAKDTTYAHVIALLERAMEKL